MAMFPRRPGERRGGRSAEPSPPADERWDVFRDGWVDDDDDDPAVDVAGADARTGAEEVVEGVSREVAEVRDQLARFIRSEVTKLAAEQQQFEARLVTQQSELVDKIVAPVLADRDATMGRVHAENQRLRDELAGFIRDEIAKLADQQQVFEQGLIDRQQEWMSELVAPALVEGETSAGQFREENENLRDQLARFIREQISRLGDEQEQFQQKVIAQQGELAEKIIGPVLAARDATVGRIRAENDRLRDELATSLQAELAKVSTEQLELEQRLAERHSELIDKIRTPALAEPDVTPAQIQVENERLRDELATAFREEIAKVAAEQQLGELRLTEELDGLVQKIVTPVLADRDALVGRIHAENERVRDQLTTSLQQEVSKLVDGQQGLEQRLADRQREVAKETAEGQMGFVERLFDQQRDVVEHAIGPLRQENVSAAGEIRDETRRLHDEVTGLIRDEISKLADTEATAAVPAELEAALAQIENEARQLREELGGSVLDRIDVVAEEHRQFRSRIAAAAGVAENRFGAFVKVMNERLDQLGRAAAAEVAAIQRMDQLGRAVTAVVEQQERLEAALGAIQKHIASLARQQPAAVRLDDDQLAALREALGAPATAVPAKAVPAKAPSKTAAPKKTPSKKAAPTKAASKKAAPKKATTTRRAAAPKRARP